MASFDEEAFHAAIQWRKDGGKQVYKFPEDIQTKPDPRCNHCEKTVYKAEVVTYNRIPYHKNCFKCLQCSKKLNPGEANPLGATTFVCNVHFQQIAKGTSSAGGHEDVVSSRSANVRATGPSLVTSMNSGATIVDTDLSAGHAWRKLGGKQVYRYPEDIDGPDARHDPRCQKCGKTCYKAEVVTYERIPYHKECFKCMICKKKLNGGSANPFGEDTFMCNVHFLQVIKGGGGKQNGDVVSASSANVKATGPSLVTGSSNTEVDLSEGIQWRKNGVKQAYRYPEDVDGPSARNDPRCQKCGKTTYKAETITYERIPYHKNCFKCAQCKRKLTAGDANPFGEDSYLCNVHYHQVVFGGSKSPQAAGEVFSAASAESKQTGPSLVVAATSHSVSPLIAEGLNWRKAGEKQVYKYPEDMSGPNARSDPRCNLCGKVAYKAEVLTYERIPYHKNCFKCIQCNKRLTGGAANPFGTDRYLCNAHFTQFALQRAGALDADAQVLSAASHVEEDAGPSIVGQVKSVRTKTTYRPPKRSGRRR